MSKQSSTKVKGNVIERIGQRADEGKARPNSGSNKVGEKWGFVPAPAGGSPKHHPMGHQDDGVDVSGALETGKGNLHGHHYGRHSEDKRKIDTLKDGQNK